jgi:hypothetical protein
MNFVLAQNGIRNVEYDLSFSPPSNRDIQRTGPALSRLGQFIDTTSAGKTRQAILTPQEQRDIIVSQVNQLGLTDMPMKLQMPLNMVPALPEPTPQEKADPVGATEALKEGFERTFPQQIERLLS